MDSRELCACTPRLRPTDLRRLKPVIRERYGFVALRHTDMISSRGCTTRETAGGDRPLPPSFFLSFLPHPATRVYPRPRNKAATRVGWILSLARRPTWISRFASVTAAAEFAYLRRDPDRVTLSRIPPSFVEYIVRLRTICVYTFRPVPRRGCHIVGRTAASPVSPSLNSARL